MNSDQHLLTDAQESNSFTHSRPKAKHLFYLQSHYQTHCDMKQVMSVQSSMVLTDNQQSEFSSP